MFGLRSAFLAMAVAICLNTDGVMSSPYYGSGYAYPSVYPAPVVQANNPIMEGLAQYTNAQRKWYVSNGYAQPVANAYAPGYINYPNHGVYKVHKQGATWHEAMNICASEGSTLAIVTTQAEADLIRSLFRPHEHNPGVVDDNHFWVGAQERGTNGQFYTIVGVRLEQSGYHVWSPMSGGQPNNPGTTDCVSMFVDGTYFDDECTTKYAFVCEKFVN